jgi:hypothetical protein
MTRSLIYSAINYLLDWSCQHKKAYLIDAPLIAIDFTTAYVLLFIPPEFLTEGQQLAAIFAGLGGGCFSFVRMFFYIKEKTYKDPGKGMGGSEGFF